MNLPKKISIHISDPWEFGEALKWRPLGGQIVDEAVTGEVLIKLEEALEYGETKCGYLIGSPRHVGGHIDEIETGSKPLCAFTGIRKMEPDLKAAMIEVNNWRGGGIVFIGNISEHHK